MPKCTSRSFEEGSYVLVAGFENLCTIVSGLMTIAEPTFEWLYLLQVIFDEVITRISGEENYTQDITFVSYNHLEFYFLVDISITNF